MKSALAAICLLLLMGVVPARAETSTTLDPQFIEKRVNLEGQLAQRYRDLIATTLPKDSFAVSASVWLRLIENQSQIEKVHLTIGLESSFDTTYVKAFQKWLSQHVSADFGERGVITVTSMQAR